MAACTFSQDALSMSMENCWIKMTQDHLTMRNFSRTRRLHRRSLRLPTRRKWAQSGYLCTTPSTAHAEAEADVLNWGRGLHLQIWDLNRAHETERTVFPIPQVFSMCRRRLWHKRKHKDIQQTVQWTLYEHFYYKQGLLAIGDCFLLVYYYPKC